MDNTITTGGTFRMQDTEQTIEIFTIQIGMISRSYLVRQQGVILVDTGVPGSLETILSNMKPAGVSPSHFRLILLTHGHADHAGSARALRDLTGAPVAVHRDDAYMGPYRKTRPPRPCRKAGTALMGRRYPATHG